ncbi:MAG: hypothetical protein ABWW69_00830 [Pyrodictiaceae archaeon]
MRGRAKLIILLYTILGFILLALGVFMAYVINEGLINIGGDVYRFIMIVISLVIASIGAHWSIVGLASLKRS